MLIGIVKVNSNSSVEKAVQTLGHTYTIVHIQDPELVKKIKSSSISKWIFTGTGLATSVLKPLAPQVPLEILSMKNKEFFCICYSMESVLYQLGYSLKERTPKIETFSLGPLRLYRNHRFYFPCNVLQKGFSHVECYHGEGMTVLYKNTVMTQWHPERTADGRECLRAWIES